MASAQLTVKKILNVADSFFRRYQSQAAVRATYGYFTHHPVAPLNRKRLKILLTQLDLLGERQGRPLRVLDLACGGGLITCAAAMLGHRVLGFDLNPEEVRMAQLFAQEENLPGFFESADLLNDPEWECRAEAVLGGPVDVIILAYALHHLPDVERFVRRLSAWMPSGAVLLVNEENPDSPLFRLKHRVRSWLQGDTDVEWHRTFLGWKTLLEASAFQVQPAPFGADLLPGLGRIWPSRCWTLVFLATHAASVTA